ncbi:glyoxalase superfamily protein [Pseudomonas sp. G.S.17]
MQNTNCEQSAGGQAVLEVCDPFGNRIRFCQS